MGRDGKLTTYLAVGLTAVGFVLMFLGWNGAASTGFSEEQFPYILSATFPGLGLVMAGLTLAVVQELRKNTALLAQRLDSLPGHSAVDAPMGAPVAAPEGDHVVATATTYHDPGCNVVRGRTDLTPLTLEDAADRALQPCRVCEPDAASEAA